MSEKNFKLIRSQIKEVVKQLFPTIFTLEAQQAMVKELSPMVESGLSAIREQLTAAIKLNRDESKAAEHKLLREASSHLNEMNLTLLAWQDLMGEKLELAAVIGPEFKDELTKRKAAIKESIEKNSVKDSK